MSIFSGQSINYYFEQLIGSIKSKINSYNYRQLKEFSESDIDSFIKYYEIQQVIVDFDGAKKNVKKGTGKIYNHDYGVFDDEPEYIDAEGMLFHFEAPVTGEWVTLRYSLSEPGLESLNYFDKNYEKIDVSKANDLGHDAYVLSFSFFIPRFKFSDKSKEEIAKIVESEKDLFLASTKKKINKLNSLISAFNKTLPQLIRETIAKKIDYDSSLALVSEAIGVEINAKNDSQNKGHKIEILPAKIDLLLPERKKYNGYYLDKSNYSTIISTIRNHVSATENNPKSIQVLHDEEMIRDTILWALNTNYFVATGETFRNSGKTDIIISFNDKSVFVAECKLWKGQRYIEDGIEQLFGYSTWRDSKMAFIVFNLDVINFALVCSITKEIIKKHRLFKKITKEEEQNYLECELKDPNNEDSTITLSVICANYVTRK